MIVLINYITNFDRSGALLQNQVTHTYCMKSHDISYHTNISFAHRNAIMSLSFNIIQT